MGRKLILTSALAVLTVGALTTESRAQDCVLPANKVIVAGSTAIRPLFQKAAGALVAADIDVYYLGNGSCSGGPGLVNGTDLTGQSVTHYDAAGTGTPCNLPAGSKVDLAVSDVFYSTCQGAGPLPAGFSDTQGPVQSMLFVVPRMSTQTTLVAEEGYFVFGAGTAGYMGAHVTPWVNETNFAVRDMTSGTQQMTALGVGLANGGLMKGTNSMSSGGVVTALTTANLSAVTAEPAIGILGADVYDAATGAVPNRSVLKALAFQAFKQKHAYYADSTDQTFDKRNVRDGRYAVWGPSHFFAATGPDGKATNARVQGIIDYVTLAKPLTAPASMLNIEIDAHVIPQCAMKAKRVAEMGDISAYSPTAGSACGCYMDERIKAGSSGCTPCSVAAPCAGGKMCSNGFCE